MKEKNNKIYNEEIEKKLLNVINDFIDFEDCQNIVFGILFIKFASDKLKIIKEQVEKEGFNFENINSEDLYHNYGGFKVSEESNWEYILKFVSSPRIGEIIDNAILKLEEKNSIILKNIFIKNYNNKKIDSTKITELIKIFSDIDFTKNIDNDLIGLIYRSLISKFFEKKITQGGKYLTPKSIINLIVQILNPLKEDSKIYDPACGTAGFLIEAKKYIEKNNKQILETISFFGQEKNEGNWKIAKLNFILNNLELFNNDKNCLLGNFFADTFTNYLHKNEKFDFIMSNPEFGEKEWGWEKLKSDCRWKWGLPPKSKVDFAWLSHILFKLNENGKAAVVMSNGSLTTTNKSELEIRKSFVKENKVDAIIQLPDKLFFVNSMAPCIWIFNNNKKTDNILMIFASKLKGNMNKKQRELTHLDIEKITEIFKKHENGKFINELDFVKTVTKQEIEENNFSLFPGQYIDFLEEKVDVKDTKEEIKKSFDELEKLFDEFDKLKPKVKESIKKILKEENKKNE